MVESGECHFSERRNGVVSTLKDALGPIKFGQGTIIGEFTVLLSTPPEFTVTAHTGGRPTPLRPAPALVPTRRRTPPTSL